MLNLQVKDAVPVVFYAFPGMETMGDRIKLLRDAKGLTQERLGELVGMTKSAVSQWEGGSTKNVKLETFLRLVEILQTDAELLIWGADRVPSPGAPGRWRRMNR